MKLLNKLTLKNLKLNKKRTIVTIMGIILSVSLLTAVSSLYASAISSLIHYETYEKGDFHVAFYDVPITDLPIFQNNREIEDIYITQNIGYARLKDSKNENKPYAFIKAFDSNSLSHLSIRLKEGRLPKNEQEIAIPTHLKTNGRIEWKVGDEITLQVGKRVDQNQELTQLNSYLDSEEEKIIDTKEKKYKIVGIIERPASNIESYEAPGYTFITYLKQRMPWVDVYAKYTSKGVKNYIPLTSSLLEIDKDLYEKSVSSDKNLTKEDYDKVLQELEKARYRYTENEYLIALQTNPLKNAFGIEFFIVILFVCFIIIFTSVFCIKNSFDISITEKIRQYGMLRSIGATKRQIRKNVFYEATILGMIGIPLGILSGLLASFILVIVCNYYLSASVTLNLYFQFSIFPILFAIALGIVTIYFSALKSARRASKITPIESIRNSADIKIKSQKIKSLKLIHKFFGIGGDISYKNLKRNKKKYRTTVISIVVSVFIFIALSSFMNLSFLFLKDEMAVKDYNLFLRTSYDNKKEDEIEKIVHLDEIDNYAIYRFFELQVPNVVYHKEWKKINDIKEKDTSLQIAVINREQYQRYVTKLGLDYQKVKEKGILVDTVKFNQTINGKVNKYKMRQYDYQKGDKIAGKINNGTKNLTIDIGAISRDLPFGLKEKEGTIVILVVNEDYFHHYTDSGDITIYYRSKQVDKLQKDIEEELKNNEYYIDNIEESARIMRNLFTLIGIFLYGFIIVISLIGITNIFNTITTNMELRRQEFAMLKSIGMTKYEFQRMIRLESIFMGIKSLLFGLPIGILLSYFIHTKLAREGECFHFPYVAVFISIIAVFLLITLIMNYLIHKINKQNTIDTIRNENI